MIGSTIKRRFSRGLCLMVLATVSCIVLASDDHHHHDGEDHDKNAHSIDIHEQVLADIDLEIETAEKNVLLQSVSAYGELGLGAEQLSHVRARFSGLIESVNANIGDVVEAGDLLAEVESNESLKRYSITSPIAGVVVQRHANKGEFTQDQILFAVANLESLWVEVHLFPQTHSNVKVGQKLKLMVKGRVLESTVQHIIPALDKPYQVARAIIDNSNKTLGVGAMIEVRIVVDEFEVPMAVKKEAVQIIDDRPGVFVQHKNTFEFKALSLGRSDEAFYEVLDGLHVGDRYVVGNSYLLKADLEKSEAEHHH